MKNVLDEYVQGYRIRCLFRAVLKLAAEDAFVRKVKTKKQSRIRADALQFFQEGEDLKTICRLAGVEYKDILYVVGDKKIKNNQKYKKIIMCFWDKS